MPGKPKAIIMNAQGVNKWQTAFDAVSEGVCLLDPEGRVEQCNTVLANLLKKSPCDIISSTGGSTWGSTWSELARDMPDYINQCPFTRMRETLRREALDIKMGDRWLHVIADPALGEAGTLTGAVVVVADISERKRSQELYRMLVDAIPSSVLLIEKNLQIMLANKNFLEKMRVSKGEIIGRRITEVFPKVILDEMDLEEHIRQVFRGERATQGQQLTYRAPGVPLRFYYYKIIPVAWGLEVENVMLLMNDVTEQIRLGEEIRRMERHLASVVESANDIILSTDTQGRILTWNKAAEMISGYSFGEVKGRFFYEYCAGDHHDTVKAIFSNVQDQTRSHMAECQIATKEGGRTSVSWGFYPMKNDLDQVVGLVGVGRDLTERRKFEMQIVQSQKLAALGVMAGGIAHEIRNPLGIASSAAQFLMEDDITSEFQKECAQKVYSGIQRASAIIGSLLRFAHPSARADARADMEGVDLLSVLTECLTLIGSQAKIQKIELRPDFPEGLVFILGLAGLLEQAFMNLLLNALQAMPNGGTLSIAVRTADRQVLVCITDTGHGIPNADIGKIFDPFYTTSPVGKGTGLGLSICYSIIKEHFGSIEVDSAEGEGTRFTVRLPLF